MWLKENLMTFEKRMVAMYGDAGQVWLDQLSTLLQGYADLWRFDILPAFENLSYNYVAPVRLVDGTPAVFKIGFPSDGLHTEIAALRHFDGKGMARLLNADEDHCAMLLEHVVPGETLWNAEDELATAHLLDVMSKLWCPYEGDHPFKAVEDWGQDFQRLRQQYQGVTSKLDVRKIDKAEKIFFELSSSSAEPVLLHGDLHHDNVLSTQDGSYLAIDPKGVLGEPCYEVGAFLRNPFGFLENENPRKLMERRVEMIVERLGFDRQRVLGWGFSQAILSAVWCDEDGVDCGETMLGIAELLETL